MHFSRPPSKGVRPARRSDDVSKAGPRPVGVPKKSSANPRTPVAKVIDSNRRGVVAGGGVAGGGRRGVGGGGGGAGIGGGGGAGGRKGPGRDKVFPKYLNSGFVSDFLVFVFLTGKSRFTLGGGDIPFSSPPL